MRELQNPHITYGVIYSESRIWVGGWAKNLSSPCILQYEGCFLNFFLHSYDTRADWFCDTTCEECYSAPRFWTYHLDVVGKESQDMGGGIGNGPIFTLYLARSDSDSGCLCSQW